MTPDSELLAQFARTNADDAFAELVRRHVNLVYSAALRQVNGDAHLAQDVAQTVFTDLARKSGSLARRETLTGWLYTSAHFAAAKIVRGEKRRRDREETFMRETIPETAPDLDWEKLQPVLDAAMHELKEADREAILLRYFENQPFFEVGAKLGLNENAARMRVERALEKLRGTLAKRGLATATALAAVISANAVQLAPANLAATLTTASVISAGTGTFTLMKILTATKLKLAVSALVVAGATTAFVIQHQAQEKLRADNVRLTQQFRQLQTNDTSLSNRLANVGDTKTLLAEQFDELLRLRGEVTRLQAESDRLAQFKAAKVQQKSLLTDVDANILLDRVARLKQRLDQMPDKKIPELQFLTLKDWLHAAQLSDLKTDEDFLKAFSDLRASAKNIFGKMMHTALWTYAVTNSGILPNNILELQPYFKTPVNEGILRRYVLLPLQEKYTVTSDGLGLHSPPEAFSTATKTEKPLILEKAPVDDKFDTRLEVSMGWSGALGLEYYSYTNGIYPDNDSLIPSGN